MQRNEACGGKANAEGKRCGAEEIRHEQKWNSLEDGAQPAEFALFGCV